MIPTITAFERSPDGGMGLARDTRVRWALEEVGQPYEVRLVSFSALKQPAHRALHPFGQIPTYEEGDLVLFETGAIVFHIAQEHEGLLPDDADARARIPIGIAFRKLTLGQVRSRVVSARDTDAWRGWRQRRRGLLPRRPPVCLCVRKQVSPCRNRTHSRSTGSRSLHR